MSTENQKTAMPSDGPWLIQDVLADLGWAADAAKVAERVRRLDVGLPAEDEFSVVCSWLGKCKLIHKLDQQQAPVVSEQEFQVPDLLAKFSTCATPVLIEVKTKQDNVLSFKPDYLTRLRNYAELVGMPLLIAWKWRTVWMLFEATHLKKADSNFNISIGDAIRESLLGELAGDVAYKIGPGAGLHIRMRKDKLVSTEPTQGGETQEWMVTIDEVGFTDLDGKSRDDLDAEVQSLFTAWDLEESQEHTESHVYLRFIAAEDLDVQFAHMSLVNLLNWELPSGAQPHWRSLLRKKRVTASVQDFTSALDAALRQRIVSHVFQVRPRAMPAFLQPPAG